MSGEKHISKIFTAGEITEKDKKIRDFVMNVGTTPRDNRFPSANQANHCWNRYNEWLICLREMKKSGGSEKRCTPLRQYALSLCPSDWTNVWDEEREEGRFSGVNVDYQLE